MKKSILLTAAIVLFLGTFAKAQGTTQYTWDTYKTKFKIGKDFVVKENTSNSFSAGTKDINLTIYPRTGGHNNSAELLKDLKQWVKDTKVTISTDGYLEQPDLNGYHGYMVDATSEGWPVLLMNIVDPLYTDIHLYVWISYDEKSFDLALEILKSFTPN